MTTQHEMIGSDLLARHAADPARDRAADRRPAGALSSARIGGNVANGDPGNDMPAVMMALDASYQLQGPSGERATSPRASSIKGAYVTALEPGEILDRDPHSRAAGRHGYAYEKLKRKIGDYATAAAAVVLTMSRAARSRAARSASPMSPTRRCSPSDAGEDPDRLGARRGDA